MNKKFTYKQSNGRVTFRRGTFPEYTDERLNRLETENEPVAAVLKALHEFEEKEHPHPLLISEANKPLGECPNCGSYNVTAKDVYYCYSCGQALCGTAIKKKVILEITNEYVKATDTNTGEITKFNVEPFNTMKEVNTCAQTVFDEIMAEFCVAYTELSKTTADAAESGSEDGGNE